MKMGQLLLLLPLQRATILRVGFDSCALLEAVLGIFHQLWIIKMNNAFSTITLVLIVWILSYIPFTLPLHLQILALKVQWYCGSSEGKNGKAKATGYKKLEMSMRGDMQKAA